MVSLEEFLIRAHILLPETPATEPTPERPLTTFSATKASQGKSQARLLQKWKLYQRVQELHGQGMGIIKIAVELGLARNTVRKYLRQAPEPPLPTPRPLRESQLDRYEDCILKRWKEGERNAAQIYREGSRLGISRRQQHGTDLRAPSAYLYFRCSAPRSRKERAKAISPRALRWLLTRKREDLDQEEQIRLDQLLKLSPDVESIYALESWESP